MGRAIHGMTIEATDVSQQHTYLVSEIPDDATVDELIKSLIPKMGLPASDVDGNPLVYQALNERAGRHLLSHERVAEVLEPGDLVVMQPDISAGGVVGNL